ncbi:probable voltage-dependent N-type calcium channel subunit alpha-1B [Lingula anatina]|uniref:Probable voltage-dependent N-type calcium channel subunit alpha-1B n=1 Tax=Lingula anatina TaxID=7574 RepID=A0A1S3J5U4_LINAN|nr:probable voltage-dependent N-type calcium channel subunit alpha-1B [Lingula anatina]|eukprot:XP_013405209.2 probable voltage-dependent N-type calcium channel subunit alpha-1B [Lingula anatina]
MYFGFIQVYGCSTGEAWQDIMLSCISGAPCEVPEDEEESNDCGTVLAYMYFVSFVFFSSFLMLNLFVAVIMDNFDYLTRDSSILGPHHLDEYIRVWSDYDPTASGRISYQDMYDLLRNLEPPVGFGKKCPYRLAYRKLIRMNMPVAEDGTVHFTTTLFALVRESLQIKMSLDKEVSADEMDQKDEELRDVIRKMWPLQSKKPKTIKLLVPPNEELNNGKMTVGKIYAGLLIAENWKAYKASQTRTNHAKSVTPPPPKKAEEFIKFLQDAKRPQSLLKRVMGVLKTTPTQDSFDNGDEYGHEPGYSPNHLSPSRGLIGTSSRSGSKQSLLSVIDMVQQREKYSGSNNSIDKPHHGNPDKSWSNKPFGFLRRNSSKKKKLQEQQEGEYFSDQSDSSMEISDHTYSSQELMPLQSMYNGPRIEVDEPSTDASRNDLSLALTPGYYGDRSGLPSPQQSPRSPRSPGGSRFGNRSRSPSPRREIGFSGAVTDICDAAHTIKEHDRLNRMRIKPDSPQLRGRSRSRSRPPLQQQRPVMGSPAASPVGSRASSPASSSRQNLYRTTSLETRSRSPSPSGTATSTPQHEYYGRVNLTDRSRSPSPATARRNRRLPHTPPSKPMTLPLGQMMDQPGDVYSGNLPRVVPSPTVPKASPSNINFP